MGDLAVILEQGEKHDPISSVCSLTTLDRLDRLTINPFPGCPFFDGLIQILFFHVKINQKSVMIFQRLMGNRTQTPVRSWK